MMLLCSCYGCYPITQTFTLKAINSLRNNSNGKVHYLNIVFQNDENHYLSLKIQVTQTEVVIMEGN